uniref:Reverse transcriptase/retrotransposon-derived protein RNase H-like domain-containing protein n=1 Tax=Lactuca sativa TaxID=4236 RepID=A0A9R1UYU2_LACSA|nr:hypothetical protein LSAT_V11C700371320 [Lactuca sativa]
MIKPGTKEIKQKKRVQGGDQNKAINLEVAKLTNAKILREAIFPTWIANPVMVRKHEGSWRMCIDYSDLNKACPKDCYPLPEIDQKVESLLKNAGATYQRLVDSLFTNQIGRNIEARMKLNPAKCTFRIEEGQFLGYYVTKDGIQPSATKVTELEETPSPCTMRDAEGLNGKLTTLSRFISLLTEKAMPLFNTLKGCIEKNNFRWTTESEEALQRIKKVIHTLPNLASPIPGEVMQVYLSTSRDAISSALAVDREGHQLPVYFVSRAL